MAGLDYNPFQAVDINVPLDFHEECKMFSQTGSKTSIDHSPFPRMVDFWFLSFCLAVKLDLKPANLEEQNTKKMIDGSIFSSDPWRVYAIMLVSIGLLDDIEILAKPRKMMALANGLAVSGYPKLVEMLKDGDAEPIWNLSDSLDSLLRKKGKEC